MSSVLPRPEIDGDGFLEYSVVYTDRALNHMSQKFRHALASVSDTLKSLYRADHCALVPGSGTSGMEAVARQLARGKKCLIVRNGLFSFRWTQILEQGNLAADTHVCAARRTHDNDHAPFAPAPIDEVCEHIARYQPDLVFAPHVETASGMMLPDSYIRRLAEAAHAVGALLVIDAIASGCMWLNMRDLGIDIIVSAPQKGLSASPCCGIVLLNEHAHTQVQNSQSDSFALDLKKWLAIMQAFENGAHAYHATPPTDALYTLYQTLEEAKSIGFDTLKTRQAQLGAQVRALLAQHGFPSVAAAGFEAPGVVVVYTHRSDLQNGSAFAAQGMQIAAGVPLQCNEGDRFQTFRIGLFGLDKLADTQAAAARLAAVLEKL
ncbi:aminotransferase class V-fold PLP-dependent enzyme [Conchiformibius steedae DSM 2580]|uniref:Aminotransferase class V-fold PLP-dependent enzyme n=1 Tax=Conchiformibius steedae DSM 2580 TaxID=1121352 RepID=A0AAE9HWN3_9NEIS|nr:aminotransferase class V-fold PLP-dependent enzyme [Conchiformibius steedae]QMT33339.1 alanine--glyoxylate aminotransferase family protein [Conchiformibius steedae]URD67983.1 aminotransferase class V-fold PLP-dependent enzyme [Conchiformibius steedae DSM 2580]